MVDIVFAVLMKTKYIKLSRKTKYWLIWKEKLDIVWTSYIIIDLIVCQICDLFVYKIALPSHLPPQSYLLEGHGRIVSTHCHCC